MRRPTAIRRPMAEPMSRLAGAMTIDTLLSTKLHIPAARPDLVRAPAPGRPPGGRPAPRAPADARLRAAGFRQDDAHPRVGRRRQARRVAWLSLDEGDNDAGRFLRYVIAALNQADERIGPALLASACRARAPGAADRAHQRPGRRAGAELLLVLDDYHLIREFAVHDLVAFLLANQPPDLHLVHRHARGPAPAPGPPAGARPGHRDPRAAPALHAGGSRRLSQPDDEPGPVGRSRRRAGRAHRGLDHRPAACRAGAAPAAAPPTSSWPPLPATTATSSTT